MDRNLNTQLRDYTEASYALPHAATVLQVSLYLLHPQDLQLRAQQFRHVHRAGDKDKHIRGSSPMC